MSSESTQDTYVSYNGELDILTVDRMSRDYSCSVVAGDTIVDFAEDGSVRGVEIQNVSRLLDRNPEELVKVSDAAISSSSKEGRASVTVKISVGEEVATVAAQLPAPATA